MSTDSKGRPLFDHWLGIAQRTAADAGVAFDLEQAWAFRKALFDARAEGFREGIMSASRMPGSSCDNEHARGWAEGARAAVDGFTECSRVDCGKPARHFYINHSYCDEHEADPDGPAHRS